MSTIKISHKASYKVGNDFIITTKVNERWNAYFKSAPDIYEHGANEAEAIGNLIKANSDSVVKVA